MVSTSWFGNDPVHTAQISIDTKYVYIAAAVFTFIILYCFSNKFWSSSPNSQDYGYLEDVEYNQTVLPKNFVSGGKVISVYDGDTITVASKIDNWSQSPIFRWKIR